MARKTPATMTNEFPKPDAPKPDAPRPDAPKPEAAEAEAEATPQGVSPQEAKRLANLAADSETRIHAGDAFGEVADGEPLPFNPKRGKSRARFALYREGMTVADYIASGGYRADIPWDVKRGFITLRGKRASYYTEQATRGR